MSGFDLGLTVPDAEEHFFLPKHVIENLERIKLRYYGTKRQERGRGGFMQLTLKGGGASLACDSGIEGFRYIAWRAAKAARDNGVSVDPASAGNLLALGLDADGEAPPPDH